MVLGSINMDLVVAAPRLPLPGETIAGDDFDMTPGGKGANQAVAAAKLGAEVRMVGRVGEDAFGPMLLRGLESYGVDVSRVASDPDSPSGTAVILLGADRENHIVAVYGANMRCDDEQVREAQSALDGADCLLLQLEVPLEVSLAAARIAREKGVPVILDPAPASAPAGRSLRARGRSDAQPDGGRGAGRTPRGRCLPGAGGGSGALAQGCRDSDREARRAGRRVRLRRFGGLCACRSTSRQWTRLRQATRSAARWA